MTVLIGIALKSVLVAGLVLGLLQLMKSRSAAERSWVAHIGLLALLIMALAPLVLPQWKFEAPTLFGHETMAAPTPQPATHAAATLSSITAHPLTQLAVAEPSANLPKIDAAAAATALYAVPAAILLIITLLALVRLFALRARAEVLVDGHWLSALARAQRRMGFKHGTALLTSNELASPISWGLVRPVILLNNRAIEAADEAEAIIAHELAHVARMDWFKLLLARFATAMFWFNPLVWLLAREAHQLREEAADDTVLAADIVDTDYAQLLVGVARHDCPSLLLGAHGVAPSKNSLARRVARVLDGKSVRGPVARSFGVGVFAGAVLVAAPLAALTITPVHSKLRGASDLSVASGESQAVRGSSDIATDLPHLIVNGVSTSVGTATAAFIPQLAKVEAPKVRVTAATGRTVVSSRFATDVRGSNGGTVTIFPPDSQGHRSVIAVGASGATAVSYAEKNENEGDLANDEGRHARENAVKIAIEMKALGVTPEYVAAIRSASRALHDASLNEIVALKEVGATPDYIREIANAGFPDMRASEIQQARALGLSADYMRAIRATGVPVTFNDLVELRAMGVNPTDLARIRAAGLQMRVKTRATHRVPPVPPPPQRPEPPEPSDGG